MILTGETDSRDYVAARCDSQAMERLKAFIGMLVAENKQQNLVAAATLDSVWRRHIADSAQLLDLVPEVSRGTWMDLGSGAGFPGLVIAIMRPDFHVKLVESRRLRSDWLSRCVDDLKLDRCIVYASRAETIPAQEVDVLSARAFAPLPKTLAIGKSFSTADTAWLLPKGRSAAQEVADLPLSLRKMFHVEQSISDPHSGIVVGRIMEKAGR